MLFNYSGETTEKYISFSVPIEKQVARIDENGDEITKTISYRIESTRFKPSIYQILSISFMNEIIKINLQSVIHVIQKR